MMIRCPVKLVDGKEDLISFVCHPMHTLCSATIKFNPNYSHWIHNDLSSEEYLEIIQLQFNLCILGTVYLGSLLHSLMYHARWKSKKSKRGAKQWFKGTKM